MNQELEKLMIKQAYYGPYKEDILRQFGFVDGFRACYAELEPQLTRLQKKLEIADKKLEIAEIALGSYYDGDDWDYGLAARDAIQEIRRVE
jgi:hypothetical protein